MSRSQLKIHIYEIPTFTVAFRERANANEKFQRLEQLWFSGNDDLERFSGMSFGPHYITKQCEFNL